MSTDTYSRRFPRQQDQLQMGGWNAMPEAERKAKEQEGMAAWKGWVEKHQGAIVEPWAARSARPRRSTARASPTSANEMGAFTVVRAASHEAAAKMFENHPHFAIFPGETRRDHAGAADPAAARQFGRDVAGPVRIRG